MKGRRRYWRRSSSAASAALRLPIRKAANTQKLRKLERQICGGAWHGDLPPSAIQAALAASEAARTEVLDEAAGKVGDKLIRARALPAKIPVMVEDYRKTVEAGVKVLADPKNVSAAREMVRKLVVDGKIGLAERLGFNAEQLIRADRGYP